jgi:ribosomal-protein-serine acetyltransferase
MPSNQPAIVLRPFEERDAESFVAAVRESVSTVGQWMPWCHADYSIAEAREWFAACARSFTDGSAYEFGVFSEKGGEFLGGAGLNQFNRQHYFGNLGYWVRETRQRRRVAICAVKALAGFGFEKLSLARIEIVVAQGNEASEGVARKIGARFEGLARNRLVIRGESVTASVYSLIPSDAVNFGLQTGEYAEVRQSAAPKTD